MRYFVPQLVPAPVPQPPGLLSSLFGKRSGVATLPVERMGGVPHGLPADAWPRCSDCGTSQALIAQFAHDENRLPLGREGRMLYVFQCNHDPGGTCETWGLDSGAHACLVIEPEVQTNEETPVPTDAPMLDNAVFITAWQERDDGLTPEQADAFRAEKTYHALGEAIWKRAAYCTHLGGVPAWIQSADEAPDPGWDFIGQLDGVHSFYSPTPPLPDWVWIDAEQYEGRTHYAVGPNFGDGGIAYLFARRGAEPPEVKMFWQCG